MTLTEPMFMHHKPISLVLIYSKFSFVIFLSICFQHYYNFVSHFCVAQHCQLYIGLVGSQATVKTLWQGMYTEVWGIW